MNISSDRGSVSVEFALISIIFIFAMMTVFDLTMYLWQRSEAEAAAAEGARYASIHMNDTNVADWKASASSLASNYMVSPGCTFPTNSITTAVSGTTTFITVVGNCTSNGIGIGYFSGKAFSVSATTPSY